jgi:outer membrane protein
MNIRTLSAIVLLGTLAATVPATAQERVLGLDEAVRMAFDAHPAIAAANLDLVAAKESEGVALAGFLPQVGLTAGYQRTTANIASTPGVTNVGTTQTTSGETFNYFTVGATLVQPIWDFGRTLGAYRAAQATVAGAALGVAVSRLDLWNQVMVAYYGVHSSQRFVDVATRTRDAVRRHAQVSEAFYKVGSRPRLDMIRAQAEAQSAEAGLGVAIQGLDLARSALLTAIGLSERFAFTVAPLDVGAAAPMTDLDASVDEALKSRPERARMETAIQAAQAAVTQAMGDWFPILSAGMGFTDAGTKINDMAWNWNVNVGLTYPLFSGLATLHGYRAAKANLEAMKVRLREYDLSVRFEVEQARVRIVDTSARLQTLGATVAAANEAMHLAEERYKAGEGNAVEFMDARKGAADAETEVVRAEYEVGLAWTAFQRALGTLPKAYRGTIQLTQVP